MERIHLPHWSSNKSNTSKYINTRMKCLLLMVMPCFCLPNRKYGAVLGCGTATESYGVPSVHQVGACRGGARIKRTRNAARVVKGHTLHTTPITHPAGYVRVVDPGSLRLTPATQRATQFATTATAVESTPTQISCSSAFRMWWKDVAQWGGQAVKQKLQLHRQQPTVSSARRQQLGECGGCWMQQEYKESIVVLISTRIFPSWSLPVSSSSCVTFCALHT